MADTPKKKAWDALHTTQIKLKLNNSTDADILAWLDKQPSKQGAIKQVIRNYDLAHRKETRPDHGDTQQHPQGDPAHGEGA